MASPLISHLALGLQAVMNRDEKVAALHFDLAQELDEERQRRILSGCLAQVTSAAPEDTAEILRRDLPRFLEMSGDDGIEISENSSAAEL